MRNEPMVWDRYESGEKRTEIYDIQEGSYIGIQLEMEKEFLELTLPTLLPLLFMGWERETHTERGEERNLLPTCKDSASKLAYSFQELA